MAKGGDQDRGDAIGIGLVGAGEFGSTFVAQARRAPDLEVRVLCDLDAVRARSALLRAGHAEADVVVCAGRRDILTTIERGGVAVVDDLALLSDLPLSVVVEATGDPEGAVRAAETAQESGYHTVMVTKEAEVLVGPELGRRARAAGLVHTPVEGDQPALLIALVRRARLLGLPVVAAGKATESDYVYDPLHETLSCWGKTVSVPGYGRLFQETGELLDVLEARLNPQLAVATVPDLCEMAIVANYCGLAPDTPGLHAPAARPTELARIFVPKSAGGLLQQSGRVDVFACLRRPDELSFAGGVFVVVEMPDSATGRLLGAKGLPSSRDGRYILLHNPVHLLGIEAIASVISAARGRLDEEGARPDIDLIGRANRDIAEGELLAIGNRHALEPLDPLLVGAAPLGSGPVPYYLAAGHRTRRSVARGSLLTLDDVHIDRDSARYKARVAQDLAFGQVC